jgi:MFS family permease
LVRANSRKPAVAEDIPEQNNQWGKKMSKAIDDLSRYSESEIRRSVYGGLFAMFVDSWDLYLPALVLPSVMSYFLPPGLSPESNTLIFSLFFTVGLLGRPIGSLIFGSLSDRIGRKKTTYISVVGFTVCTLILGVLPGYASLGVAVIWIILVIRLVGGMFLAGGYAAPMPLAFERAPRERRGLLGGLLVMPAPGAFIMVMLFEMFVDNQFSKEVGWRLPFLVGGLLGVLFLFYYSKVPELRLEATSGASRKPPLADLFSGEFRPFIKMFLLTLGMWLAAQMVISYLPGFLVGTLGVKHEVIPRMILISSIFTMAAMLIAGIWGQAIGRRKFLIYSGWSIAIVCPITYGGIVYYANSDSWLFYLFAALSNVLVSAPLGVVITFLNEQFPPRIRGTGFSVAYTFGTIVPAFYSLWLFEIGKVIPFKYSELVLIFLGGLLFVIGAALGKETTGIDMLEQDPAILEPAPAA